MNLYSETQNKYIQERLPNIVKRAAKIKLKTLEPTIDEYKKGINIIIDFIIEKKRIIYGGYALNQFIIHKNKKEAIYDNETETPDIEFYSPDPINDLIELCNIFEDNKFKYVQGKSAQHKETYSLFSNFENYCDISYVPTIVYKNMPTKSINKLLLIHPHYMYIDILRMFNDPMTSHWRWEKTWKRQFLLQKYYPFPDNKGIIKNNEPKIISKLLDFIKNKETMILFNYFAYNYFIKSIKGVTLDIPYIDIISINYVEDCLNIYNFLKNLNVNIEFNEYYPFYQFYGCKCSITINKKPIVNIYHNNHMCIPLIKNNGFNIVTFPYAIMMLLILIEKTKIDKEFHIQQNYKKMFSNLLNARNKYLRKYNKTILDNTPFKEFNIGCIGTTMTQPRMYRLELIKKKEAGKKMTFMYTPSTDKNEVKSTYVFRNTSGNLINNPKNKKIKIDKS
jgi:hypothetical protein